MILNLSIKLKNHLSLGFNRLNDERDRWLLWVPVFMVLGVAGYFQLTHEPDLYTVILLFFSVGVLAVALHRMQLQGWFCGMMYSVFPMIFGFCLAWVHTHMSHTQTLEVELGPKLITGQIHAIDKLQANKKRYVLENLAIPGLPPEKTPKRVRIMARKAVGDLRPGMWVEVLAVLRPPPPPVVPGGYDFQRAAYFQGLGGTGFALSAIATEPWLEKQRLAQQLQEQGSWWPAKRDIERLRYGVGLRIKRALGEGDTAAVAKALLNGDRGEIPEALADSYRASGLAHLLAISGLHVGLVAGLMFLFIRRMLFMLGLVGVARTTRLSPKNIAAVIGIAIALFYTLLAGATPPTQRAFLMITIIFLGVLIDRKVLSMRTVALAAALMIMMAPEIVVGASFQLSFSAVIALIAFYETYQMKMHRSDKRWKRVVFYVLGIVITSLIASLATTPLSIFHFHQFSTYGVAANLFAIPVMAFWVMPMGLLGLILMPFGLEVYPLIAMGWGVDGLNGIALEVASWSGALIQVGYKPDWVILLVMFGVLWLSIWQNRIRIWGMAIICLGGVFMAQDYNPSLFIAESGKLAAQVLDDGKFYVTDRRRGKFAAKIWAQWAGYKEPEQIRLMKADLTACDQGVCRANSLQENALFKYKFINDYKRLEDVSIVNNKNVFHITQAMMQRQGSIVCWLDKKDVRIRTLRSYQGRRPWCAGEAFIQGEQK